MKICPHCHANSLDGWDKCSRCGMPIAAPSIPVPDPFDKDSSRFPASPDGPQQALQNERHKFCPHCKTPAELDAAQCGYCRYDYRTISQQPTSNPSPPQPAAFCVNLPISGSTDHLSYHAGGAFRR